MGPACRRELLWHHGAALDVVIDGDGPALVLLPSSLRDSLDFDPLAHLLAADGFQVLRPQPRGMGRSSPPPAGMTLETLADDVAAVIRHYAAPAPAAPSGAGRACASPQAVVIGHAYGHWVARVTGLRHPDLVRGVVVLGAAAREFPPGMADALAVASDTECSRDERLAALRLCMFAPGNDPSPWLEGWHPQWRQAYREAGRFPPKDAWFGHSHAPVLDLQGAQDAWRPEATRQELAQALGKQVTIEVIDRAGHALVPEQPQAIARAVARWARRIGHV